MITVGLDLSLQKTGLVILKDKDVIFSGLIKSKPAGKNPTDEIKRLMDIVDRIFTTIDDTIGVEEPNLVLIEGIAFMARNSTALSQLSGLSYLTRAELILNNWPFVVVAPTTLKKFITGKGNADKNIVMMSIYKNYKLEFFDDNEADGFSLAACGMALLSAPLKKITQTQQEVINLLKIQL